MAAWPLRTLEDYVMSCMFLDFSPRILVGTKIHQEEF